MSKTRYGEWAWRLTTGFVRYDYNGETHRLVVRMPTGVHELFIDGVEDAIRSQLKAIRSGSGNAARFAQKVRPARSTGIEFPVENALLGRKSKYEPDASFWHDDAQYPRVIIKVAYSQEKKRLGRLAEDHLLDSDANIRIVVGLDIKYGKKGSRKATLSVWRTDLFHTPNGDELRVVQEVADEVYYIVLNYVLYQHLHFTIPYSSSSLGVEKCGNSHSNPTITEVKRATRNSCDAIASVIVDYTLYDISHDRSK
jgi:hypothetical protein